MKYSTGRCEWEYGQPRRAFTGDWHKLLGPCPQCGAPCYDYGGGWRCCDDGCFYGASDPAPNVGERPQWWGEKINVFVDGDAWCAVRFDFINPQQSVAGFGHTPREAVASLLDTIDETDKVKP